MNRAEKRRQKKRSKNKSPLGQSGIIGQANPQSALQTGISFHQAGMLDEAILWYQKTLKIQPRNVNALINLGFALINLGKSDEAVAFLRKAISIKHDHPEAHYNLGNALSNQGKSSEAMACFQKSITFNPQYPEALNNLGNILSGLGKWDEAIVKFKKAVSIRPDFLEAYSNLGYTLKEQGKLAESVVSFQKALSIQPGFADVHYNLGCVLKEQGKFDESVVSFQRALSIQPDNSKCIDDLGFVLESMCYEGMAGLRDDLTIDQIIDKIPTPLLPDIPKLHDQSLMDHNRESNLSGSFEYDILKLRIKKLAGEKMLEDHLNFMQKIPSVIDETITNNQKNSFPNLVRPANKSSRKMVAFFHFGRSGSGLFHSLLDGHPEISTMPGVYMSGYFCKDVWQNIASNKFPGIASRFAQLYRVLFDSRTLQTPPPPHITDTYGADVGVGVAEGFDKMGENHDSPLLLDENRFISKLEELLNTQENIDQGSFFEYIHEVYETMLGNDFQKKKIILHHAHQLHTYSMSNFLKYYPDASLLMIIRNPMQSCESWSLCIVNDKQIKNGYKKYDAVIKRICIMLRDVNSVEFSTQNSVGIRLEDIKKDRRDVMRRLCKWFEIEDSPTLYESTMQGLKWWGDPGSKLFGRTQTVDHGKDEPINRDTGILFSEKDRRILEILFYPLSVRFDYVEKNDSGFIEDLHDIRPLLEKPLDFERVLSEGFPQDYPDLEMTAAYKYFHAMLLGCWRVLDEFGTYPNMFSPLPK